MDVKYRVEQYGSREEWLRRRMGGIGSSDAVALACPDIAYETPYSLWAKKSGLVADSEVTGSRIDWGNRLEPEVARWWSDETGREVERRPFRILRRVDAPHLIASPDALVVGEPEGLEIKTAGSDQSEKWDDGVPLRYMVQVQHQMMVTGWQRWHLAVLIGGNDPRRFEIQRDDVFIAELERACGAFWRRVLTGDPPPLEGRDPPEGDIIAALWPAERPGSVVTLPESAVEWHLQRERASAMRKQAQALYDEATLRLTQIMGDAEASVLPDGTGYRLRTESKAAHMVKAWSGRVLRFTKHPVKGRE